jgi:16S rRNA (guanine527-N7)-methyltransferase
MQFIPQYFPNLSPAQYSQFELAIDAYKEWNQHINVVSRKDIEEIEINHFLHSISIAKYISFNKGTKVLDIGTGGGFPGVPMAILFPDVQFTLVDSIGKKIKVVEEVCKAAQIHNVRGIHSRAESISGQFDFILSRAVTAFANFIPWTKGKFSKQDKNPIKNGILYLKGGDLAQEIAEANIKVKEYALSDHFKEPFFETKKLIFVPAAENKL